MSWVKTTVGRGLHVWLPIEPTEAAACLAFARSVAGALVEHDPVRFTVASAKAGRERQLLIDTLRNNRTNISVAAYSLRARAGGTVSVPLEWEELTLRLDPTRFTIFLAHPSATPRERSPGGVLVHAQKLPGAKWLLRGTIPGARDVTPAAFRGPATNKMQKLPTLVDGIPLALPADMGQRDKTPDVMPRILVADGDQASRNAVTWCLLSEGFRVDPVADGFAAAAALQQDCLPTLAIIDLGLEGFHARRLIEHIMASPRLCEIPVVATGFVAPFAPLPKGVQFFKKPCRGEALMAFIRELARRDEGPRNFFPSRQTLANGRQARGAESFAVLYDRDSDGGRRDS